MKVGVQSWAPLPPPGAYGRGIGKIIDPAAAPESFDPITEPVDASLGVDGAHRC